VLVVETTDRLTRSTGNTYQRQECASHHGG
jgi:hypothetical protein